MREAGESAEKVLWTLEEVAYRLQVSHRMVLNWCTSGRLRATWDGWTAKVAPEDVDEALQLGEISRGSNPRPGLDLSKRASRTRRINEERRIMVP